MKSKTEGSNKINTWLFIVSLLLVSVMMFIFIGQKKGFHEDEIFSYGSSNYKYDNIFYYAADRDPANRVIDKYVIADSFGETMSNFMYYQKNASEFSNLVQMEVEAEFPIWKTSEDAKEYLTVAQEERGNYLSPYYNQTRDVHPPLFYFLVHFVSGIFAGVFSKYIIFAINLIFVLATCIVLRKILRLYQKDHLIVPLILLYGLGMGAVSTVIFLRMYAMVTFFTVMYFYLTLKMVKNDFFMDRKTAVQLIATTVLGFLSQYFICLFILPVFVIMAVKMLRLKKNKDAIWYTVYHIISAVVGILLFPPSIYHIFFSYRGFGSDAQVSIINQITLLSDRIFYSFSVSNLVGIIIIALFAVYFVKELVKQKKNPENSNFIFNAMLFVVPLIVYILLSAKLSPAFVKETMIRYIMPILPLIALCFVVGMDRMIGEESFFTGQSKTICIYAIVAISVLGGLVFRTPTFLYKEYEKCMEVAEEYKDLHYVYLSDNYFTYLGALPEMLTYDKSMIITIQEEKRKNALMDNEELKNADRFILAMEAWIVDDQNPDNLPNEILSLTGYTKATPLLEKNENARCVLYLIEK